MTDTLDGWIDKRRVGVQSKRRTLINLWDVAPFATLQERGCVGVDAAVTQSAAKRQGFRS